MKVTAGPLAGRTMGSTDRSGDRMRTVAQDGIHLSPARGAGAPPKGREREKPPGVRQALEQQETRKGTRLSKSRSGRRDSTLPVES